MQCGTRDFWSVRIRKRSPHADPAFQRFMQQAVALYELGDLMQKLEPAPDAPTKRKHRRSSFRPELRVPRR
jgi:hypothetical protein